MDKHEEQEEEQDCHFYRGANLAQRGGGGTSHLGEETIRDRWERLGEKGGRNKPAQKASMTIKIGLLGGIR